MVWTKGWCPEGSEQPLEWAAAPAHRQLLLQELNAPPALDFELSSSKLGGHLRTLKDAMAGSRPLDRAANPAGDALKQSCCPSTSLAVASRLHQKLSSWQQQSQMQQELQWKNLTCYRRGVQADSGLGRVCCLVACSIAHVGGLDGTGLRCSPAPGLRAPCPALGRGPSATASGRSGLGSRGCLWEPEILDLIIAASCCGSHLQEQASSWSATEDLSPAVADGTGRLVGSSSLQVLQQPPADREALCEALVMHVLLLQPLPGAGQPSDWLQQHHALLQKIKKHSGVVEQL